MVDATTDKVLETKVLTPNSGASGFDKIKEVAGTFSLTYSESRDDSGNVTRNIRSSYMDAMTYVFLPVESSLQGTFINIVNLKVPNGGSNYSYYKVVDYDQYKEYLTSGKTYHSQRTGNEKDLSTYVIEGQAGQNFHTSGTAEYDKYELVESADENKTVEGTLSADYIPGTATRTGVVRYVKRLQRVVNENGDAVIEIWILDPDKVDVKKYDAGKEEGDAQIQTDNYIKIFETPVLKSGESDTKVFELNWKEWVEKSGLKFATKDETVNTAKYTVENGGLFFPAILDADTGKQFSAAQGFSLQNDYKPRSDSYYYYVEKGSVIVHYEDTEGNVIKKEVIDTEHGVTDSEYNTTDHKDSKIVFNGATYYLVQNPADKNIPANEDSVKTALSADKVENNKLIQETTAETGKVKASTDIHLTYVYEKAGSVKVNYLGVDSKGNVLDPISGKTTGIDKSEVGTSEYDTKDAQSGTAYNTTDLKPETIQDEQGRTWRLVTATNPHSVTDGVLWSNLFVTVVA